jgi:hypothetical protein
MVGCQKSFIMKTKILITLVILISLNLSAQKYIKSQFTLFDYTYEIDAKVKAELTSVESYITFKPEGKQNKVEGMLVNSLYDMIVKTMEDSLKIFMLPPNSLTNKVKYDEYGYPSVSIQRALKLVDTKYFLKIKAFIGNDIVDNNGNKLPEGEFKPKIKINLYVYDKYGYIPIHESEASASAIKSIIVTPKFIAGLSFVDSSLVKDSNEETLADIFNSAILEAVNQLQHKKNKKF